MTMTTREVTIFLGELGQIRELLGEIGTRVTSLERSIALCQQRCNSERQQRKTWLHYAGAVIASLIPAAVLYVIQMRHLP